MNAQVRWPSQHATIFVWGVVAWLFEVLIGPGRLALLVRPFCTRRLARIAGHVDCAFYLRQFPRASRRRRVAADPLLHYALVGWREGLSPNPRFDPRYVKTEAFADEVVGDPLARLLEQPSMAAWHQNEVEAAYKPTDAGGNGSLALVINHSRGGGSTQYLTWYEEQLRREGLKPLRLRLVTHSDRLLIWARDDGSTEVFDFVADPDALVEALAAAHVDMILVNHLIDFHHSIQDLVLRLTTTLGARLQVILHDYFVICPRINLMTASLRPCRAHIEGLCADCRRGDLKALAGRDPASWRSDNLAFLAHAETVIVPSEDMCGRIGSLAAAPLRVLPPENDEGHAPSQRPSIAADENLRVAVIGSLNAVKGSLVVLALARAAKRSGAPIDLHVIGNAENARDLRAAGVVVTGRYRACEAPNLISRLAPHLVLLPAIWPETWSFALANAFKAGVPVRVFDHGAPAIRLRRLGCEEALMPLRLIDDPDGLLDLILAFRTRHLAGKPDCDGLR